MVFPSSSLDITDVINTLCSLDGVKSSAQTIRDELLNFDFGLQDDFCDAKDLKLAWKTTNIYDEVRTFHYKENYDCQRLLQWGWWKKKKKKIGKIEIDENDVLKLIKIGSLLQTMCYNLHNGNKQTRLHLMNAVEIYEWYNSR